ncbi:hypothetical protein ACOSQ3_027431 [Xanthoceras sorbifolium]
MILLFRYEQLLEHYFSCGMVGHLLRECPDSELGSSRVFDHNHPYGSWLRATSLTKSHNCIKRGSVTQLQDESSTDTQNKRERENVVRAVKDEGPNIPYPWHH